MFAVTPENFRNTVMVQLQREYNLCMPHGSSVVRYVCRLETLWSCVNILECVDGHTHMWCFATVGAVVAQVVTVYESRQVSALHTTPAAGVGERGGYHMTRNYDHNENCAK